MILPRGLAAILLACLAMVDAHAGELPPPPSADLTATRVFVQLVINGDVTDGFVPLDTTDGKLLIDAADLRKAGISIAGEAAIDLSARPDIQARYDALEQRLYLDVALDLLPQSRLHGAPRERIRAQASTGAAFNYSAYVQRSGSMTTASLFSEQRLFGRLGALSTNGVVQLGGSRTGYLRYDTRYRFIDQDGAWAFSAGDVITASLPWSTSVRMGGLQFGRNFASRPDLITTPLPSFAGEAAVPSSVDLFIDGYRTSQANVAPGRFVLDDMPVVNGAGQATIVTTDAVGRQVSTTIPFYVSAQLLRAGLTDFSVEVGALRRGYGIRSFGYGAPAASFVVRHGFDQRLTLAAHGEASRRLALGGVGIDWAPGLWGTAHATISASRSGTRTGTQVSLGYDYSGRRFSVAAEHRRTSGDYRDLGDFDLASTLSPRGRGSSTRAVASAQLGRLGSASLSYIDARARSGARTQLVSAGFSLPLSGRTSAFASADYDLRRNAVSAQIRLIMPFGRASTSVGVSQSPGRGLRGDAQYDLAVPTTGGLGLSAAAAADVDGNTFGQANAILRTRPAQFEAGGAFAGGQISAWAGASGSVIAMDGGIFAANAPSSSFAVVSTGGVGNVPVTYENQPIGRTDARGRLFIRDVTAFHPGRVAIDPLVLDAGLTIARVETSFAVAEGAGAVVRMPIRHTRSATAKLIDAAGKPIAAGSIATLADGTQVPVGWDGIVYLDDLPGEAALTVKRNDGASCHATLALPAKAEALANLGAVPCT